MLLEQLKNQLRTHLPAQEHFLIGLSGGVDSVVLLQLFSQLGVKLRALHVHHGLSPNADRWAEFCEQLCKRLNIPFILQKVAVEKSLGIEAGARAARYQAITETILSPEVLVTAHHLDDQAETFLLALKRGSGVKGLSAMQAVVFRQHFAIFRPLLSIGKTQILHYAAQHGLEWVEDESNINSDYDRNFLRREVLPLLNQRWPHFNRMVARSAGHCAEQQKLLEELLTEELEHYADFTRKTLQVDIFPHFSPQKQRQLIRLWLEKCGEPMPSGARLKQILDTFVFARQDKNPQLKLGKYILRRYRRQLYLTPEFAAMHDFCAQLLLGQTITLPDRIGEIRRTRTEIICKFSGKSDRLPIPNALQNAPLTVKLHHSGKVKRYGLNHREEMKKLWQQANIPLWQRCRTPLIFWREELVFLVGTTE